MTNEGADFIISILDHFVTGLVSKIPKEKANSDLTVKDMEQAMEKYMIEYDIKNGPLHNYMWLEAKNITNRELSAPSESDKSTESDEEESGDSAEETDEEESGDSAEETDEEESGDSAKESDNNTIDQPPPTKKRRIQ